MKLIQMSDSFESGLAAVNWAKKQTQLTAIGCRMYIRANDVKKGWIVYRTVAKRDHDARIVSVVGGVESRMPILEYSEQHKAVIELDSNCMTIAEYMKKYHREIQ